MSNLKDKFWRAYYRVADLSVKRFWENITRWFSYYGISRRIYDFDYSSILAVERHQLERVRDSIAHFHNHLYADRDIEHINLALRLLDIIEENGCAEYHGKEMAFNDDDTVWLDPEGYYTLPVYVNARNAKRFINHEPSYYADPKIGALHKDRLRCEKAWHLYHKLRLYFMRSWWD